MQPVAEVGFLDSSGVGVLAQAMQVAQSVPAAFRVRNPAGEVFDQLRTGGLLELFALPDDRPEAPG